MAEEKFNVIEKWSENWQLCARIFLEALNKQIKEISKSHVNYVPKISAALWWSWRGLLKSQTRANIFTLRILFFFVENLNAIENESWCFLYSFLMYTHWWLIVGYSCWWGCSFMIFPATHSLSGNLNFCPRSLMTLTENLWNFCVSKKRQEYQAHFLARNRRSLNIHKD